MENLEYYLMAALLISEGLAQLPFLKENSILELALKLLRAVKPKKKEIEPPKE